MIVEYRSAKYYDKMSKKEIALKIVKRRFKAGLKSTFFMVIASEDIVKGGGK